MMKYMLIHVQLFAAPWTVAHQAPLPMEFSGQEYWSGMPLHPPGDLPDPGIEPASLESSALAGRIFTISATCIIKKYQFLKLRNKEVTFSLIVLHSAAKCKFCLFVEWYSAVQVAANCDVFLDITYLG